MNPVVCLRRGAVNEHKLLHDLFLWEDVVGTERAIEGMPKTRNYNDALSGQKLFKANNNSLTVIKALKP